MTRKTLCGFTLTVAIAAGLWMAAPGTTAAPSADAAVPLPTAIDFNRDIRPIFAENCYACHGPDKKKRKAHLRLDDHDNVFAPRKDYALVVPGNVAKSELYGRITTSDDEDHMPPTKSGKKLTPRQIELIKRWIEQGAKWQGHWAWIKPVRPVPPQVRPADAAFVKNPIDQFVLARQYEHGLHSSPEADRVTLIRRLSFDLIGLPPTPEQVDAFVADTSPQAYEKLVDRLLSSPHYGERMANYWLDLVRYADSIGYHSDNDRDVWLFRDYVIQAFNGNMPFDRFTIEQLGGDLLPNATSQQIIASGYNRLLQTTEEGGAQPKEYMAKYAADRVRNVSTVWLGATMGCSECHDHKFDPFTQRDFYSMEAFFADIKERAVGRREQTPMPTLEHQAKLDAIDNQIAAVQKALDAGTPKLATAQAQWEASVLSQVKDSGAKLGSWFAIGPFSAASFDAAHDKAFEPEKEVDLTKSYGKLKWVEQPKWADGQAQTLSGDNSATYLYRTIDASQAQPMSLSLGSDDSIKVWHNGKLVLNHKIGRAVAPDQEKLTINLTPGQNHLLMKICNGTGGYGFYFKVVDSGLPANIVTILRTAAAQRDGKQKAELAKYYRSIAPQFAAVRASLAELQQQRQAVEKAMPTTLITVSTQPRTIRVLPRGNWQDDSGAVVEPAVPQFLADLGIKDRRANRLDLARWLASRDNPLTARVFMNRLWKQLFGEGLARTLEDVGAQGQWPTHPEMLDWLAVEFMDSGWDVKHMVKLIAMSGVYRQTSLASDELRQHDPYNKWLARQNRFRLDAEFVRDNALAVSGLLSSHIGGPSVKPYQPAGYWAHLNFPTRRWQKDSGDKLYRRGLYTHWQRTFLHPSLLAFDAPSREECTAERARSNTPQQALVLLNDPTYVEASRVFAERVMREGKGEPAQRINWAFRQALSRNPEPAELAVIQKVYEKHLAEYTADKDAAAKLISVGDWPVAKDLDASQLAAWTSVVRVIMNLNESITRR